ncbi:unnamed protein product [Cercopithifilaria johnstoni]|uniref:Uncharacterized protein n=1 Tax=Cercopithifilaria johnstoni TaxID=2874296 RepID=A0A8J2M549_9BILA|nr:unnamed protein product [Cercopithifilaria johnstoni]
MNRLQTLSHSATTIFAYGTAAQCPSAQFERCTISVTRLFHLWPQPGVSSKETVEYDQRPPAVVSAVLPLPIPVTFTTTAILISCCRATTRRRQMKRWCGTTDINCSGVVYECLFGRSGGRYRDERDQKMTSFYGFNYSNKLVALFRSISNFAVDKTYKFRASEPCTSTFWVGVSELLDSIIQVQVKPTS